MNFLSVEAAAATLYPGVGSEKKMILGHTEDWNVPRLYYEILLKRRMNNRSLNASNTRIDIFNNQDPFKNLNFRRKVQLSY